MPPSKALKKTLATARRLNLTASKPPPRPASQAAKKKNLAATRRSVPPAADAAEELYDPRLPSGAAVRSAAGESEEAKAAAQLAADKSLVLAKANLRQLQQGVQAAAAKPKKKLLAKDGRDEVDDSPAVLSNSSSVGINSAVVRSESDGFITAPSRVNDAISGLDLGRPRSDNSRVIQVTESPNENTMTGSGSKPGSLDANKIDRTMNMDDTLKLSDAANISVTSDPVSADPKRPDLDDFLKQTFGNTAVTVSRKGKTKTGRGLTPGGAVRTGDDSAGGAGKGTSPEQGGSAGTAPARRRLLTRALKGDWGVVDQLLRTSDKAGEVNCADEVSGMTPLMLAVKDNRLHVVERLLDLGADISSTTKERKTPLHFAALHAKEDVVKLLLNRKADPTLPGGKKDQLPLHMACTRVGPGTLAVVQALLRGANKESRLVTDKSGQLPLFLALEAGNVPACAELLSTLGEQQLKQQRKTTGDTALHIASRKHELALAKLLVDHHADVNAKNNEGQTPLHLAVLEADEPMTKLLHQYKANANIADKLERTPLHVATQLGHTALVELLVDKYHAETGSRTRDGSTLLHLAAQRGQQDTALAFLKKGLPLHMPNKMGATCLHSAAMSGHVSVIKALIGKGAVVDSRSKDNYTALHVAVEHCKPEAVEALLGFGAHVQIRGGKAEESPLHIAARVPEGEKCAEILIKSGASVNAVQENMETAMHIASRHGNVAMLQILLADGANPVLQSRTGETALHVAVRFCHYALAASLLSFISANKSRFDAVSLVNEQNLEGETAVHYAAELTRQQVHCDQEDTDMIRLLLQYGGDLNVQTNLTQETPLHYAARSGNADVTLEIVEFLASEKIPAAVNKQAKNGASALLMASEQGHLDVVRVLLEHNARVDVFDEQGKAALHLSAENGHDAVAELLLQHNAYVGSKSKQGVTPLHLAAQNGYIKLVKLLVETHGATTDALTLAKQTPLHLAARNGQKLIVSTLLRMNADANATDTQGQTPLHLAAENDHSDVVKMFLKYRPELVTMANSNGMTCAHIAASKGSCAVVQELMKFSKTVVITAKNKTNESTTLHLAATGGHADVVRALVNAGASAADENSDGMTVLHLAAKYGHTAVLNALRDQVPWTLTSKKTGYTALHVAAQYGQMEFVREMLTRVSASLVTVPPQSDGPVVIEIEHGLTPLHLAAQSGHEGLVRMLLNLTGIRLEAATVLHGYIALHLAAQAGHTDVVSLLLSKKAALLKVKTKQGRTSLHLAASHGHLDMTSLLVGQGSDIDAYDKGGWTALHYAAKAGHLEVVKLLVESGANTRYQTLDRKVALSLAASSCHTAVLSYLLLRDRDTSQLMDDNRFVLDLMIVGKTNDNDTVEEFVLTSSAPVETAVKLSNAFRSLATKEKESSVDLCNAGDYCETMATKLTAIAAGGNGASMLLQAVDERGTPLLDLLIYCQQKQVVSHPLVQKYLSEVWTGHLSHWAAWQMLLLFFTLVVLPPVWVVVSLPLKTRFSQVPVVKFMSYLVSHLYLIGLIILCIVYPPVNIWDSSDLIPHWYEWLLLAWISGLLVSQLTNPEDRAGLGWIKVVVIGVCAVGVMIHLTGFAFQYDNRLVCLYVRNQFFACSLLLCFIQIFEFLTFHHLFGPWAIIIRELMKDLMRFLVVLGIFLLGFTFNLAAIYLPVTAPPPLDPNLGDGNGAAGIQARTALGTFELLFFAMFGQIDPQNMPPMNQNPWWSIYLLKSMVGVYMLMTFIVLVNLLIAMMTDTYANIQEQSDIEWKFGRAKLFRNMNKTSSTPSPMNLLTKLFIYIKILIKHRGAVCSLDTQRFVDEEEMLEGSEGGGYILPPAGGDSAKMGWISARRGTQIMPLEGVVTQKVVHIEDVVVWTDVVERYTALQNNEAATSKDSADD